MSNYDFRLHFNLAPDLRVNSEEKQLHLCEISSGQSITLSSVEQNTVIKNCSRLVIHAEGFSSESEARETARVARRMLLLWAVSIRGGLDASNRPPAGQVTEEGLKTLDGHGPIRQDFPGVNVYEHLNDLKFLSVERSIVAQRDPVALSKIFSDRISKPVSERQELACEIYASSRFNMNPRSRLITLVMAIETLVDQENHPKNVQDFVENCAELLEKSAIEPRIKDSLRGSLSRIKKESIKQAGRRLSEKLLPNQSFRDHAAGDFFSKLYDMRSKLVHEGAPNRDDEIRLFAHVADNFVTKLLLASLSEGNSSGVQE